MEIHTYSEGRESSNVSYLFHWFHLAYVANTLLYFYRDPNFNGTKTHCCCTSLLAFLGNDSIFWMSIPFYRCPFIFPKYILFWSNVFGLIPTKQAIRKPQYKILGSGDSKIPRDQLDCRSLDTRDDYIARVLDNFGLGILIN